jgi:hypothetical protein
MHASIFVLITRPNPIYILSQVICRFGFYRYIDIIIASRHKIYLSA